MATGVVPALPDGGLKPEIVGATTKLLLVVMEEPPKVSRKGPVVAPNGTTACKTLSEMTLKSAGVGSLALNSIAVVAESPDPLMVMTTPGPADAGENPVMLAAFDGSIPNSIKNKTTAAVLAFITCADEIPDNTQLLIPSYGMAFCEFPPVDLQSVTL
jgi:hypothetical protein